MMTRFALFLMAAQFLSAAVHYSYDAAGRLARIDYDSGSSIVYSYDKAGNLLGRTTVAAGPGVPTAVSTTPASGTAGAAQNFSLQFAHGGGASNLAVLNVLINNFLDGRHGCYLAYVVASGTLVLVDDAGDAGGPYAGSVTLGNPGTAIENSQCKVNLLSAAPKDANNFLLGLSIQLKSAFGGNRIVYMAARDNGTGNSGWQALGVQQVPFTPAGTISVTGTLPARTAAGTAQSMKFSITDSKGVGDLGVVNVLINNFIDGRQGCYLAYSSASNTLFLVDDAGDAGGPFAGSMVLNGGAQAIENSQCKITAAGSSAAPNGANTLDLTLNMIAKTPLNGNRVVWVAGRDRGDLNNTDWQAMGTWSVQ